MDTNSCLCILINSVMRKQGRTYELGCRDSAFLHLYVIYFRWMFWRIACFPALTCKKHVALWQQALSASILVRYNHTFEGLTRSAIAPAGCLCPCLCCCVCPALPAQDRLQHRFLCPGLKQWKSITDEYLNFSSTLSRSVVAYCSMAFLNWTPGPI